MKGRNSKQKHSQVVSFAEVKKRQQTKWKLPVFTFQQHSFIAHVKSAATAAAAAEGKEKEICQNDCNLHAIVQLHIGNRFVERSTLIITNKTALNMQTFQSIIRLACKTCNFAFDS